MDVRGNDRGTSVDFRGCCHGLPWKPAGFHGKGHGSWRVHGKYYGCGHDTCRGSVRGKLRRTNHGNPRKSAAIATVISADVKPQQFPLPSAAIRGQWQSSDTRQLPRKAAAIATAISAEVKPQQFPRPSAAILRYVAVATEVRGNCHGSFRGPSAVILRYKAIAMEIHGNCHSNFHDIPRPSAAIDLPR